jgi:hypothetical protein
MRTEAALLIVSHTFLAGAFILLRTYTRLRFPDKGPDMWNNTLLAFGVFPTTFFFRMTYTESMFVFLTIVALLGMERKWPLLLIALVCGLATATRPVGVALIPPFLIHLWQRADSWRTIAWQSALLLPVSAWGLFAYMAYQDAVFGEPLAFARTQEHWFVLPGSVTTPKLQSLLTLEPLWGTYAPSSARYWARLDWTNNPIFSLLFANGLFYVTAITLVTAAFFSRNLSQLELVLCLGLLVIPYWTRAHEMSMGAFGRFAAVAFPLYLTLAVIVATHRFAQAVLPPLQGAWLFGFSALYAAGFLLY